MINIVRNRYVVMRKNRTEIWCGSARNYKFVKLEELDKEDVKTYSSYKKAMSCSSRDRDFEVVPVTESVVEIN